MQPVHPPIVSLRLPRHCGRLSLLLVVDDDVVDGLAFGVLAGLRQRASLAIGGHHDLRGLRRLAVELRRR